MSQIDDGDGDQCGEEDDGRDELTEVAAEAEPGRRE